MLYLPIAKMLATAISFGSMKSTMKMITMTGHGGFFNILSQSKNKVLSVFSVDEAYKAGNLFGDLENVVGEVFQ